MTDVADAGPKEMLSWRSAYAGWVREYAATRGVRVSEVLESAVAEFAELAVRSVPEIRRVRRAKPSTVKGKLPTAAPVSSRPVVAPVASSVARPASAAPVARTRAEAEEVYAKAREFVKAGGAPPKLVPLWRVVAGRYGHEEFQARRHVAFRGAMVAGQLVRNPDLEVEPGAVKA